MTTTVTLKNDLSSRMSYFTGMESITLKILTILMILILNTGTLSSQNNAMICGTRVGIKSGTVPEKPKTYTLYAVQNFPIIEISENHTLHKMDDFDHFDYEAIFCSNTDKKTTGPASGPKSYAGTASRQTIKTKIVPTLN